MLEFAVGLEDSTHPTGLLFMRTLLFVSLACLIGCGRQSAESGQEKKQPDPGVTARAGSDWPCFLGPLGTSVSMEKGIISPWPKEGLKIVWHKKTGTGYGAPSISKGKLFLFDRHGKQARLSCLDSKTGKFQWEFEYPTDYKDKYNYNNGPRCCPVIDGDRVYIFGPEGMLHCVKFDDGKSIWKVDTRGEFNVIQNFFGVGSTPVIEGNLLIVQVGGSPEGSNARDFAELKGNGSGVVAFDKMNGKVKYKISNELASYSSPVLATINGRRWCFVFARGGLVAFEPKSGKVDFHFPWRAEDFESVNAANPVVIDDKVLISETYGPGNALLKVKPGGYEVLWDDAKKGKKSMQCHWMTPIVHDGYLYGSSGRHTENAQLRCIELATGKVMWSKFRLKPPYPYPTYPGRTSLLMVDGHFIALSEQGPLFLFKVNTKEFEPVSEMVVRIPGDEEPFLEYPCWAAPVLSHGLLYIRGEGRLVCLELSPGKKGQ
jgi:outer membrane protein assembly factor BamB